MPRTSFIKDEKKTKEPKVKEEAVVFEPVQEEVIVEEETPVAEKPRVKKSFEQSDGVLCRSVCSGILFIEGPKTGIMYSFTDYDDETEIEYRDLVAMVRSKDKNIFEPRIMIDDKDFLEEHSDIDKFYSEKFKTRDIKAILEMPNDEMVDAINRLPKGAVENLKSIAAFQVANGYLDSRKKIKTLNETLGIDLDLVGELMSD